jgi:hypothetical protein
MNHSDVLLNILYFFYYLGYLRTQLNLEGRPLSAVRHCLGLFSIYIFSYFPRLKAVPSIRNLRTRRAMVRGILNLCDTPTPKNNSQFYPTYIFLTPTVSYKMSLNSHDKFRQLQIHFVMASHINGFWNNWCKIILYNS